tara:strand:+ start:345 stop:647 length:303 start_codon:yes stop_codon:yes gene_type:complete
MMSAKDLANKFSARKADTDRTAQANSLYEDSFDNAVGRTTANDWLNDYKGSVKKYLVPISMSSASSRDTADLESGLNMSDEQLNELGSYIAEKVLEDRSN